MPGLRYRPAGPHEELVRARGAAEPRPDGTRLRARRADAPQSTQACGQAATEEGKITTWDSVFVLGLNENCRLRGLNIYIGIFWSILNGFIVESF